MIALWIHNTEYTYFLINTLTRACVLIYHQFFTIYKSLYESIFKSRYFPYLPAELFIEFAGIFAGILSRYFAQLYVITKCFLKYTFYKQFFFALIKSLFASDFRLNRIQYACAFNVSFYFERDS